MPLIYYIPIRAPSGQIEYVADTDITRTALLLTSGAPVNSLYTTDASANNFDLIPHTSLVPSNKSPFSTNISSYFGSSNYLSYAANSALSFDTGDFTLECWIWISTPNNSAIYESRSAGTGTAGFTLTAFSSSVIRIWTGTEALISSSGTNYVNKWTHIAVVRQSGTTTLYIDGISAGTSASMGNLTESIALVGAGRYGSTTTINAFFPGYISNFRIVKGTAIYTANFTPPTSLLTSVAGTSLLTLQNGTFSDNSTNGFSPTIVGSPLIVNFSPFTTSSSTNGSAYFNGGTTHLNAGSNAAFAFGTGDFTVECWIYHTSTTANQTIFCNNTTGGFIWLIEGGVYGIARRFQAFDLNIAYTIPVGRWVHYAASRSGTTARLFVNGSQIKSGTVTTNYSITGPALIGGLSATSNYAVTGYMSNFRMVKGSALYTANFTPSTSPLTPVANTSLLTLQNKNPDNTSTFVSSAHNASDLVITRSGNTKAGSPNPYTFNYSVLFNGSSDFFNVAHNSVLNLRNSNFTIECWIYPRSSTYSTVQSLFHKRVSGTTTTSYGGYLRTGTGVIGFYNGTNIESSTTPTANQWNHCAWVYNNATTNLKIYLNGNEVLSTTVTLGADNSEPLTIGNARGYTEFFNGFISNFRVVKGTAIYTSNFTPSTSPLEVVTNTALLTCQSNRFVDNSPSGLALTVVSAPQIQQFNPFTMRAPSVPLTNSVFFNGSSFLLSPAINDPTGNFTIEFWWQPTNLTGILFSVAKGLGIQLYSSGIAMMCAISASNNTTYIVNSTFGNLTLNAWNHIALVRNNNSYIGYVNGIGTSLGTSSSSPNSGNGAVTIGAYSANGSNVAYYSSGNISNFRMVIGTALYTSNFTPPVTPLTAVTGTSLLTCQSSTIVDNSSNAFAITASGTPTVVPHNPFGVTASAPTGYSVTSYDGSILFDGTGDFLQTSTTNFATPEYLRNWWLHTGFTVEAWVYVNTLTQDATNAVSPMVGHYTPTAATNYWSFGPITNGTVKFTYFTGTAQTLTTTAAIGTRQWHHLAMVKNGTRLTIYINGVSSATGTLTGTPQSLSTIPISIGAYNNAVFNGYITDLRISGSAVYTANFIPSTTPLQATSDTLFLLNPDTHTITDSTANNVVECFGEVKVSKSVVKYGNYSISFDGTGDSLLVPSSQVTAPLTFDFTYECWVYPTSSTSTYRTVFGLDSYGPSAPFRLYQNGTRFELWYTSGASIQSSIITINQWYHVAMTRSGTSLRFFLNGVQQGSTVSTSTNYAASNFRVGNDSAGTYPFVGYISDLRITRSARYTANFTPPSDVLPS